MWKLVAGLRQISVPTAEEVGDLAKRVQAAAHLKERPELGSLPRYRRKQILRDGQRARSRLIEGNLRLVASIAVKFRGKTRLTFDDLFQEGVFGLIRAVDRYDPARGFLFSTYASWWIRQSLQRAPQHGGYIIRLPVHVEQELAKAKPLRVPKAVDGVSMPPGVGPGDALGMAWSAVNVELFFTPPLEITTIQDQPSQPEASCADADEVAWLISHLSKRDAKVVRHRFGLTGGRAMTLEEIGVDLGVTRERIRQIVNQGLAEMKAALVREGFSRPEQGEDT